MPWAAIIPAVASLAGAALSSSTSSSNTAATNAMNMNLNQQNMQWQQMMSNTAMQRRVADLRQAGLNPMLAVSQGGASTPGFSPIPMQQLPSSFGTNLAQAGTNAVQAAQQGADTALKQSQKQNVDADTALKTANLPKVQADAAVAQATVDPQVKLAIAQVGLVQDQAFSSRMSGLASESAANTSIAQRQEIYANVDKINAQIKMVNAETDFTKKNSMLLDLKNEYQQYDNMIRAGMVPYLLQLFKNQGNAEGNAWIQFLHNVGLTGGQAVGAAGNIVSGVAAAVAP